MSGAQPVVRWVQKCHARIRYSEARTSCRVVGRVLLLTRHAPRACGGGGGGGAVGVVLSGSASATVSCLILIL